MTNAELKEAMSKEGIESSMLDDIVHSAADSLASDANNGGIDAQVDFLTERCGWSTEDILKAAKENA